MIISKIEANSLTSFFIYFGKIVYSDYKSIYYEIVFESNKFNISVYSNDLKNEKDY